ncbi:alpha-amylase family glycosyl hydrolase [Metabacillus halosaccharovorans]|uniref:alpha-amylase family glycosyl hydrolase n=1 Tax=Bacillaceae TaxID=186817 RepID=UPI0004B7726C|nr:alpha-amylase family glycosyl hydrolase [Bacillus sp. J37]
MKKYLSKSVVLMMMAIMITSNVHFPYLNTASAETTNQTIRIYYERDDQDYDSWGLWLWGDVATPSEQSGGWPTGATPFSNDQVGEHGAYVDIELNENPGVINFIVVNRENGEKDGDSKGFTKLNEHNQVYIKDGDDYVYTTPDYTIPVENSQAHFPEWSKDSTIYEVNIRQYTPEGTFQAFEKHLPRLKRLGVEVLWLMPIHPISEEGRIGTLGSYYAVQDYKAINPEFGSMEDFKRLVDRAHDMGFKVMLDWVANHTGKDHIWTENKEWYTLDNEGNITHPPGTNWMDVADLNYENPDMRAAMLEAMKYWVKEADIDGYRADYAVGVPVDFWEKARKELDKIKPVYMLAEDNVEFDLLDKAFNFNYGWELSHTMRDIAAGNKSAKDIKSYLNKMKQFYPTGSYAMHWTTNHDENSWEGTTTELFGEAEKTMAALTFTLPGIPLIYSGQEAGLNKRLAFFDKDEISWADLSMQDFYRDLIRLKKKNQALWNGSAGGETNFLETSDDRILAFERMKGKSKVIVIVNLSPDTVTGQVEASTSKGNYHLFPSNKLFKLNSPQQFNLEPWAYKIMVK